MTGFARCPRRSAGRLCLPGPHRDIFSQKNEGQGTVALTVAQELRSNVSPCAVQLSEASLPLFFPCVCRSRDTCGGKNSPRTSATTAQNGCADRFRGRRRGRRMPDYELPWELAALSRHSPPGREGPVARRTAGGPSGPIYNRPSRPVRHPYARPDGGGGAWAITNVAVELKNRRGGSPTAQHQRKTATRVMRRQVISFLGRAFSDLLPLTHHGRTAGPRAFRVPLPRPQERAD